MPESEMVEALLDEARKLIEEGVESRLAHAEANAAELAAATARADPDPGRCQSVQGPQSSGSRGRPVRLTGDYRRPLRSGG